MRFIGQTVLVALALFIAGIAVMVGANTPNPSGSAVALFWALLFLAAMIIVFVMRTDKMK